MSSPHKAHGTARRTSYSSRSSASTAKHQARMIGVHHYQRLTGSTHLNEQHEYVTLCNDQTGADSEIQQLVSCGFLKPEQFVGVDASVALIASNKETHPKAKWIGTDWNRAIRNRRLKPGIVYLDTVGVCYSPETLDLLKRTLPRCARGTVLVFNAAEHHPYRRSQVGNMDAPVNALGDLPEAEEARWESIVPRYHYCSSKTKMVSYVFQAR